MTAIHLTRNRESEYFSIQEVQTLTGQPAERFPLVVIKELIDNGLDAAEAAGQAPEITVQLFHAPGLLIIGVEDNGPGLDGALLDRILDFSSRTSNKAGYRAIQRGAQGNALKTVIGIPVALEGQRQAVTVTSRGIRHDLSAWLDHAGEVRTERAAHPVEYRPGTRIVVCLPVEAHQDYAPFIQAMSICNPAALVHFEVYRFGGEQGESLTLENAQMYTPTTQRPPMGILSAHWHDAGSFAALIRDTVRAQPHMTTRAFVAQFSGLTRSAAAKAVTDHAGERFLSAFDNERAAALLALCQAHSKPIRALSLGRLGKDHLQRAINPDGAPFWYKCITLDHPAQPAVVEAALCTLTVPAVYPNCTRCVPAVYPKPAGSLLHQPFRPD